MKSLNIKWLQGLIAFVLALGLLLGGNQLYHRYFVNEPLQEVLENRSEIEAARISLEKGIMQITVQLAQIDNIQQEYYELDCLLADRLGKQEYKLIFLPQEDNGLQQVYDDLQPALYEAMAGNRYLWLKDYLGQYCQEQNLNYKFYIDEERVYLELCDKEDVLYQVIERQNDEQATA